MSKYWSVTTRGLKPYVPGEQPGDKKYIKLNTNENPYPPPPGVINAIRNAAGERLKLYPEPTCIRLRKKIAGYFGLNASQVFPGNGSDEVLAFAFKAFFNPGEKVIFPEITYTFYPVYCKLYGLDYINAEMKSNFSISVDSFKQENGGVIIPNPNAPTGKYLKLDAIEDILKNNMEKVVIIDEAYIDFGGKSAVSLIGKYPNLLVVQTLSKSMSLAGLRVGYALGSEELTEGLVRVKDSINSYTIDTLAMEGAIAAFDDGDYYRETSSMVISTRDRITAELRDMGFEVVDSKANFILISHKTAKAFDIFRLLKENGILVRYFNKPRISGYLRVSIGTDKEMDVFVDTLKNLL